MPSINAHAKVNIFLKITGHQDGYHTLISRFMKVNDLYDTLSFEPCECETFTIEGCEGVPLESNTIYKAYQVLLDATQNAELETYFTQHKVVVEKRIPSQAGLGGGSSDAAAFMRLANEVCKLKIKKKELARLGSSIGADVPFFIYDHASANVSGFGEIVEKFDEKPLDLELYTPELGCDTALVYKTFKEKLIEEIVPCSFMGWENYSSRDLIELIADPIMLNDLYPAALLAYPELKNISPDGWCFSGSGSTFFRIRN